MITAIQPKKFYARHTVIRETVESWCKACGVDSETCNELYASIPEVLYNVDESHYFSSILASKTAHLDPLTRYVIGEAFITMVYSLFPGLVEMVDALKDYGKPEVSIVTQNNYLIVVLRAMNPETDYVGEVTKLVDAAIERDEFIPYAVLRFIGRL